MLRKCLPCLSNKIDTEGEVVGQIDSITFYPLKSARGIEINACKCTMSGLKLKDSDIYDRWV